MKRTHHVTAIIEREGDGYVVFSASLRFGGLVITEFNPDHADEDGSLAATFVEGLTTALSGKRRAG